MQRYTLKNGLRIWCAPRPNTQTVALVAQFPVGSRSENDENNGISHFLEHMVFTGTERWNESDVTDVVRRRGGECNAQTSREETIYYLHVAAQDLEFGLDWLHQLLFKPTLSADKFEKERQVIISEKGGEYDYLQRAWEWLENHNLGWSVSRTIRRRLFPDSSFLLGVIGTDRTLKALTYQEVIDYYQRHYSPNNMTLLVVGDVDPAQVFALTERQFGDIPARPAPGVFPSSNLVTKPFHVRMHGPTPNQQGQYMLGALLGPGNHPDRFAWYVIGEILENAYLQEIRYEHGFSYDVQAYPVLYTDVGYFNIYTTARLDDFEAIKAVLIKHLDRLVAGDISEQELREAKAALRGQILLELQDNLEYAMWLSNDALFFQGDTAPTEDYLEAVEALSLADVHRVACHYLTPEKRFSIEHRPPQVRKPLTTVSAIGVASAALFFTQRRRQRRGR